MILRACKTKEGHFRWIFLSAVTHFEKKRISLVLHVSEYAMTFYEGILFVTTLENSGCSKVLEVNCVGWAFFFVCVCVVFSSVFINFFKKILNYTLDYAASSSEKKSGTGVSLVDGLGVIPVLIIIELVGKDLHL